MVLLIACVWVGEDALDERLDMDGDGFASVEYGGEDCDDDNDDVFPGAEERCNGQDDNCDPADDELWTTVYADGDGDGWGSGSGSMGCPDEEVSTSDQDCDDAEASVFPGADEVCDDGVDQNCDGSDCLQGEPQEDLAWDFGGAVAPNGMVAAEAGVAVLSNGHDPVWLLEGQGWTLIAAGGSGLQSVLVADGEQARWQDGTVLSSDRGSSISVGSDGTGVVGGAGGVEHQELLIEGSVQGFGDAVLLCELTGDGQDELVIGSPRDGGGLVLVDELSFEGETSGDYFGAALGCGDVDGDGLANLLVGAPRQDEEVLDGGAAWVFDLLTDSRREDRLAVFHGEVREAQAGLSVTGTEGALLVGGTELSWLVRDPEGLAVPDATLSAGPSGAFLAWEADQDPQDLLIASPEKTLLYRGP